MEGVIVSGRNLWLHVLCKLGILGKVEERVVYVIGITVQILQPFCLSLIHSPSFPPSLLHLYFSCPLIFVRIFILIRQGKYHVITGRKFSGPKSKYLINQTNVRNVDSHVLESHVLEVVIARPVIEILKYLFIKCCISVDP